LVLFFKKELLFLRLPFFGGESLSMPVRISRGIKAVERTSWQWDRFLEEFKLCEAIRHGIIGTACGALAPRSV
jgi:hypothetical protein